MPSPTTITMILKGLLATFVNKDETECTVGILKVPPPDHKLEITLRRQPLGGPMGAPQPLSPIADELRLMVENTSRTKIAFRDPKATIDRQLDPTNQESFRWVVDLESAELYDRPIGASQNGFSPLLKFNNGELFTRRVSINHLFIKRGLLAPVEDFGFVAVEIGVEFNLDQANSRAVFTNGGQTVFDSATEPDTNYKIEINNDGTEHPRIVMDATNYYSAVGLGLTEADKILFASVGDDLPPTVEPISLPVSPEAACFPSFLSQSQPEP
jgi:hypothetical protein